MKVIIPLRALLRLAESTRNPVLNKNKINREIIHLGWLTALATAILLALLMRGTATSQASDTGQPRKVTAAHAMEMQAAPDALRFNLKNATGSVAQACNSTLTINPTSLPVIVSGVLFRQNFTVTGASGAVTWSVNTGSTLPAGFGLTAAGAMGGVAATTGTFPFTLKVTDASGCVGTRAFSLVVTPPQSLGNMVWMDTNRNGYRDSGEQGVGGVRINLYRDTGDGQFNASTDKFITETLTDSTGNYRFINLVTGTYFVQIERSNFFGGSALNGCISTSGNAEPNSDADNDDNGVDSLNPVAQPPVSGAIILTTNGEPPQPVDSDDTNGNNTIDFGFVNLINLSTSSVAGCVGPGSILEVTATLNNPFAKTQPDNPNPEFSIELPASLTALADSCNSAIGSCTVVNSKFVTWNGTLATNAALTLRFRARVGNNLALGVLACYSATSFFDVDNNGTNETAAGVENCVQTNCPQTGPGQPAPGASVLIYPMYSSNATNPSRSNTRINITNTSLTQQATMHLFFVDGEYCTVADSFLCLTPNQTASFLLSDLDPGTTGYLIAVAVDPATGCPAYFNYLVGDEFVKLESGHMANLKAEGVAAQPSADFTCSVNDQEAFLRFDGVQYAQLPRVVAIDNFPSPADDNETRLYLSRVSGNLSGNVDSLGEVFGLAYDDAERAFSFGTVLGSCQLRSAINGSFPRTAPRLDTVIPSGRSGWMKLWIQEDGPLVGAVLNRNLNVNAQAGAFNGGRNLHTLRYAETAVLRMPLFPAGCR